MRQNEQTSAAAVDGIFRSFAESENEQVRAWVQEFKILALRPLLGPVIAYYVAARERQFYELGLHCATVANLAKADNLGERTIVTRFDEVGRIAEMVKLPMTLAERLALEQGKGDPTT